MKPRFSEDYRLLCWMFLLMPSIPIAALLVPSVAPWLLPFGLYFAYCSGIASHNHNHCPVFTSRTANMFYATWLSVFYGYPLFAWVPTHNQNHHKFRNGEGDDTRTTRYASRDTLWHALSYPLASAVYQSPAIKRYLADLARRRPQALLPIAVQYLAVLVGHTGYLLAALELHGGQTGLLTYALAMGLPSAFALWSMMFTNYIQHVDCDATSQHDHSRNFVGRRTNWFLFNAGYHTVHHEQPGTHWSRYRALHEARARAIHPDLNQPTVFGFCWKTYLVPAAK